MAEPFISEIKMFGFNFPPVGWAQCDGQTLTISDNQALYALVGTTFGGDGRTNFKLPDMRGRTPVSIGNTSPRGMPGGTEYVRLSNEQMAAHTHPVRGTTDFGDTKRPSGTIFASGQHAKSGIATEMYSPAASLTALNPNSVTTNGGGGEHSNTQPSTVINFCIALKGLFPARD